MTADLSRDSKALIKEAELLSASNDFVYKFYREKASQSVGYSDVEIDEQVEDRLLLKNDPFIDIVLAQYCFFDATIFKLFSKSIKDNILPLRLACLSNESVGKFVYCGNLVPSVLFGEDNFADCPILLGWFKSISHSEIDVLFKNKSIDINWLSSLLDCDNEFWNSIDEEKQRSVIRALSHNSRIQTPYQSDIIDGDTEYHYNKLFYSIWDLSQKIPTTVSWAASYGRLLEKTVFTRSSLDVFKVANRWDIVDERESKTEVKSFLNSYDLVRFHLYKNLIKDSYDNGCSNSEHFDNTDIAYRACAYSKLQNITINDMNSIVEKDGSLAIHYLLMNDNLWMLEELREALKDLCFKVDEKSRGSDLDCVNSFLVREKKMEELHPKWFLEKIFDESNDDDKPLNLGMMREFIKELKEDLVNSILLWSNSYGKRIMKIEWIFYGVIATVVLVLMK